MRQPLNQIDISNYIVKNRLLQRLNQLLQQPTENYILNKIGLLEKSYFPANFLYIAKRSFASFSVFSNNKSAVSGKARFKEL